MKEREREIKRENAHVNDAHDQITRYYINSPFIKIHPKLAVICRAEPIEWF